MGCHPNIAHDTFPKPGPLLGQEVLVCFNYDTENSIPGKVIRDDANDPWVVIIQLEDGRVVLSTECQFRIL